MVINLLDNEKVRPIAMSGLKCMFVSKKEYNKDYKEKKRGSRTAATTQHDITNLYRAAYSTPAMFGEWLEYNVDDQCDEEDNRFARWVAEEYIDSQSHNYKDWIRVTMSKKVVECVTEALEVEYDNLIKEKGKSKQQKEEEEKEKAREERRQSGS